MEVRAVKKIYNGRGYSCIRILKAMDFYLRIEGFKQVNVEPGTTARFQHFRLFNAPAQFIYTFY